jgi:F-type H+-transporting ATPase subunit b
MDIITQALKTLGFDWQIALANLVNFALVFWLLNKFVFKGLRKTINERAEKIREGLDNATQAETVLHQAQNESQEIINQAKRDAMTVSSDLIKNAEGLAQSITEKAQNESSSIIDRATTSAQAQSDAIIAETREKAIDLVISATQKVATTTIDKQGHDEYIKSVLQHG